MLLLQNPFEFGAMPLAPDEAAASFRQTSGAAATFFSGDANENLQDLQSDTAGRGFSHQAGLPANPLSRCALQDLHKGEEAGEAQAEQESEIRPEGPYPEACTASSEIWENSKAGSLPSLSDDNAAASSGWASQRLLEAASGEMALPELPRSGASELEADGDAIDLIGEIFAGARKLFDPDPAAYTNADQAYYDLLLAMDDPRAPNLIEMPYGMEGLFDPAPLFLRQAG